RAVLASSLAFRTLANEGLAPTPDSLSGKHTPPTVVDVYNAVVGDGACLCPCAISPSDSGDGSAPALLVCPALFATATARSSSPLLPLRFTFVLAALAPAPAPPAPTAAVLLDDEVHTFELDELGWEFGREAFDSMRLRNGPASFSLSARSCTSAGGNGTRPAAAAACAAACAEARFEFDHAERRRKPRRCRIHGLQILVSGGGGPDTPVNVMVLSLCTLSFRSLGLGGELSSSSLSSRTCTYALCCWNYW
ncbi:hypothetical protein CVT25_013664, partial [Psilocybe cyanescens]